MAQQTPHNIPNHVNIYTLDHDDARTGHGKHDRIVSFCSSGGVYTARIDYVHGLGRPTNKEVLKYAKHHGDIDTVKGWELVSREMWDCGTKEQVVFFHHDRWSKR